MSQRLTINQNNKPIYDIVYEMDFSQLPLELEKFDIAEKKLCIITDSKVNGLYSDDVCSVLKDKCKQVVVFSFPDGEKSKNLDTVKEIYEALGDRRICVARELTKINEEIVTYTLSEFVKVLEEKEPRGEYVLIVEGAKASETAFFEDMSIEEHVEFYENQGLSRMDAIKACARDRHVPKNAIYKELV